MKKLFTILFVLAFTLPATAQQMIIEKNGSNNEIVNLDDLKQITVSGTIAGIVIGLAGAALIKKIPKKFV